MVLPGVSRPHIFAVPLRSWLLYLQAVIMYWTSSAAFSLVQSWIFDYWEAKHKQGFDATSSLATAAAETPRAPPRT